MSNCRHDLVPYQHIDVMQEREVSGVRCTKCSERWIGSPENICEPVDSSPAAICRVCQQDAGPHNDSTWQQVKRAPHLCRQHTVCPECETAKFKYDGGKLNCVTCGAAWGSVSEFEQLVEKSFRPLG